MTRKTKEHDVKWPKLALALAAVVLAGAMLRSPVKTEASASLRESPAYLAAGVTSGDVTSGDAVRPPDLN
jgi:hypothetical protein